MAQIPLQGLWETSVLGRLMNFAMDAWTDSRIGRALAQMGTAFGRVFADSFPGRVWYSDWPEPRQFADSRAGRALNGLGGVFVRVGRSAGPWLNGLWETSTLAGAGRAVAGALAPYLGTSLFYQAYTGFARDVDLAPEETGRRPTSPLVLLLGTVLGILPLIPSEFSPSPTVLTILGVWGLAFLWIVRKLMTGEFRWRGSAAFVPLGFLLVIMATATVQSIMPRTSLLNLIIWLTAALIFWMTVDLVRNSRDAAAMLGPVLAGGAVLGVWAVYHQIHPPVVLENWTDPTTSGTLVRSFASMGNPNYLAEYMVLYLPLGFALWLQNQKRQIELALPLVLMAIALFFTWSRGGWLAFALALAVIVVMRFPRWTIFGVLGALLVPLVAPQSVLRRLASAFTTEDTSNAYRLNVWKGVEAMLHKYWVLGTGPGAEVFAKGYEEFMLAAARAAHSHNTFLQVFAELGILGLIGLVWLLVVIVRRTFVVGVRVGSSFLIAAVPAAMVGIFFQGLVEHIWYNPKLLFAFWAVAGLGVGVALGDREDAKA